MDLDLIVQEIAKTEEELKKVNQSNLCIPSCPAKFQKEIKDTDVVGCETCDTWFHYSCVNETQAEIDIIDKYACESCRSQKKKKNIYISAEKARLQVSCFA
jgi:hypothetical protein